MPVGSLLVAGAVSVVTGLAFVFVALTIGRRPTSHDMRTANLTLVLWWGLLGGYLVLHGALTVLASYGGLALGTYLASRVLVIPLLCGAVASLLHHLVFLYTGNARTSFLLALGYVPIALVFAYATFAQPQTLHVSAWLVGLDDSSPLYRLTYAMIGLPPILASIAYLGLLRRITDPLQRLRVTLVALTIIAYVGSGLAARLTASDPFKFVTLVGFGLAAAALVLFAYRPPEVVAARLTRGRAP